MSELTNRSFSNFSKRLVENKYQNMVEVCERQTRDLDSLSIAKLGLEDHLSQKTANLVALQQELVRFCQNF